MKELMNIAANFCGTFCDDGTIKASLEMALITSEPFYEFDAGGDSVRRRKVDTYRFTATPKQARLLAKQLYELADECDLTLEKAMTKTVGMRREKAAGAGDKQSTTK